MKALMLDVFLTVLEALRRWWRGVRCSRRVVPVPIPVRRSVGPSRLRELDDQRTPTALVRRRGGR